MEMVAVVDEVDKDEIDGTVRSRDRAMMLKGEERRAWMVLVEVFGEGQVELV